MTHFDLVGFLRAANADSLVVIATPSYEDGFTPAIKNDLKLW